MPRKLELNIPEIEKYYIITEDGCVWTKIKDRWLKPRENVYGYIFYSINKGVPYPVTVFAHTLVALKYIGQPPTPNHEIDHIDNNKANNHYTNLQWVTHSQNQLKAYSQDGRCHYWLNKQRPPASIETKIKMANAKKKPVLFKFDGMETIFDSIEDAANGLGSYRRKIYRCITFNTPFSDRKQPELSGKLSFYQEKYPICNKSTGSFAL